MPVLLGDIKISQATAVSPPAWTDRIVTPTAGSLLGFDADGHPFDVVLGSNLTLTGNVLSASGSGGGGTVTSVGLSVPSFLSVAGSPITTSGTLAVTLATQAANRVFAGPASGADATPTFRALVAGDIPDLSGVYQPLNTKLSAISALANSAGWLHNDGAGVFAYSTPTKADVGLGNVANALQLVAANNLSDLVSAATARTNLGATTVGGNLLTLTNPSAITFIRLNADNTVSALDAASFRTAIGAGTGSGTVTDVTASAPLSSSGGTAPNLSITQSGASSDGYLSSTDWTTFNNKQPAGSYVTSVSVTTANGFSGSSSGGTTPALTLSTSVTGVLKGDGAALSAAVAATDYVAPSAYASANGLTMATARLLGRTTASTGAAEEISVGASLSLASGVLQLPDTITAASVGSSTAIPVLTFDAKGRLTAASTAAVVAPAGTLSGTTLNSTVVTSSLTTVGALNSGSITSGFGSINIGANSLTAGAGSFTTLAASGATNLDAGTVSAPGLYLEGETGTGLYRIGANNHGYAVSGSKVLDISSTGLAVTGTLNSTVADAGLAMRLAGATGRFYFQPYFDATWGQRLFSLNTAESAYQPLSLIASTIRLAPGATLAAEVTSAGLNVVGGITATKDNGGLTLNNSTTGNAEIYWQAGGVNKYRLGTVGGATPTGVRLYSDADGGAMFAYWSNSAVLLPMAYSNTTASAANVFVQSDGTLKRSTSSLRYKRDVRDYTRGLADVMKLRPVLYKGISEGDGETDFAGFIAEDVAEIGLEEFVVRDSQRRPDALAYSNMVALLTKAAQELKTENDSLKARVSTLESAQ